MGAKVSIRLKEAMEFCWFDTNGLAFSCNWIVIADKGKKKVLIASHKLLISVQEH